jgi:hypothetical protein
LNKVNFLSTIGIIELKDSSVFKSKESYKFALYVQLKNTVAFLKLY